MTRYFTKKGIRFLLIHLFWFEENSQWIKVFTDYNYKNQEKFLNQTKDIIEFNFKYKKNL